MTQIANDYTWYNATKIRLSWTGTIENGVSYEARYSTSPDMGGYATTDFTEATGAITVPNAGSTYYVMIVPYRSTGYKFNNTEVRYYGPASEVIETVSAPNQKTASITHVDSTTDSIAVNWEAVPGANYYQVTYYSDYNAQLTTATADTAIVLTGLNKNATYTIKVTGCRMNSAGSFISVGDESSSVTGIPVQPGKMSAPEITSYLESINVLYAESTKPGCADGVEYELWTAYAKKDKRVAKSTGYRIENKAIGKKTALKVRVRAYITNRSTNVKKYGAWSGFTYTSRTPEVKKITNVKGGQKVTIDTIKGADRYIVMASASNVKNTFKKVATTTKSSVTVKKIGKNKLKKGKTYYYYIIAQKKVGKKYITTEVDEKNYWSLKKTNK